MRGESVDAGEVGGGLHRCFFLFVGAEWRRDEEEL